MLDIPPSTNDNDAVYRRLTIALFLTLTVLVLLTFRHYGMSWDEPVQNVYGEDVLKYYTSFFTDRSAILASNLAHYGGFFELVLVLAIRVLPFDIYETRHLITALGGIAGIFAAWKVSDYLAGPRAAFWTALLLTLYPSYYGHMFINSKDIPFAVFYMWSIYYLLRTVREFPNVCGKTIAGLGLAIGLTMAVRVGGLILLCYAYVTLAVCFAYWSWQKRASTIPISAIAKKSAFIAFVTTSVAYGAMLLFWPLALSKPFVHPFTSLAWLAHIKPDASSMDYVPRHLLFKLPELILVLAAISVFLGIRWLHSKTGPEKFTVMLSYALLICSSLFPLIYAVVTRPYLYDEIRHFLFAVPPLCCIAGVTLQHVFDALYKRPIQRRGVFAVLALYFFFHIALLVQLHPYEYAYYNRLAGGINGAYQQGLLIEYWATSYKQGVETLQAYLRDRDGAGFEKRTYRILVGPAEWCAQYYFPPNFVLVTDVTTADIYLSTTRSHAEDAFPGREVVAIRRFEVPFTVAKIEVGGRQ